MLDEPPYKGDFSTRTTYPVLAGKVKMPENLLLHIHTLLVGYGVQLAS
jgi:hypothetical protein